MSEPSPTASTIIRFAERLEEETVSFYEKLAAAHPQAKETFLAFAKEAAASRTLVSRTYQETVSDAIETGFSFEGLNLAEYTTEDAIRKDLSYRDALKAALAREQKAERFYAEAAERSQSLLATVPRAFHRIAETRRRRKEGIEAMLNTLRTPSG